MKTTVLKWIVFHLLALFLVTGKASAQIPVTDGANFAQSLLNYIEHIVTAGNTMDNLTETTKIFQQGKKYYDALQNVHGIIKEAHKVKESVGYSVKLIGEYKKTLQSISSDSYFTSYQISAYNQQQSVVMRGIAGAISDMNNTIVSTGMSLSDKDRMDAIDTYHERVVSMYHKSRMLNLQMESERAAFKRRKAQRLQERNLLR